MIKIVVTEREFGCGGGAISEKLVDRLGWKLFDRQLTTEIARLAQVEASDVQRCDEWLDPLLYRLGEVLWRGSSEKALHFVEDKAFDADRMVFLVQQVIEKAAEEGNCVIVGRGAPWFLRGRPDAFSVFLYAPRSEKIRRLTGRMKDEAEAIQLLNTVDSERAAFVKRYFGKEWPTGPLYHTMLNTLLVMTFVSRPLLISLRPRTGGLNSELASPTQKQLTTEMYWLLVARGRGGTWEIELITVSIFPTSSVYSTIPLVRFQLTVQFLN